MLDNMQFKDKWEWRSWYRTLSKLVKFRDTCLGILIPDKLCDYILTFHFFDVYNQIPREMGFPIALATQNGMQPHMIDFDLIDCLFIGGSHSHKKGKEGQDLIKAAKENKKWVHVGRVQSKKTITNNFSQADSFDGTTLIRHKTQQLESIVCGLETIKSINITPQWCFI